jgi:hypothetical protein
MTCTSATMDRHSITDTTQFLPLPSARDKMIAALKEEVKALQTKIDKLQEQNTALLAERTCLECVRSWSLHGLESKCTLCLLKWRGRGERHVNSRDDSAASHRWV